MHANIYCCPVQTFNVVLACVDVRVLLHKWYHCLNLTWCSTTFTVGLTHYPWAKCNDHVVDVQEGTFNFCIFKAESHLRNMSACIKLVKLRICLASHSFQFRWSLGNAGVLRAVVVYGNFICSSCVLSFFYMHMKFFSLYAVMFEYLYIRICIAILHLTSCIYIDC